MRIQVPLRHAYRLLNHGPTTLVTSAADGRANVMAAAWVMPLDFDPPRLAAVIAEGTYTRELVDRSGELCVNVPTRAQADLVWTVGSVSGREVDKLSRFGVRVARGAVVGAPLVEGCAAWLECRVLSEPGIRERYDLYVAEVVAAWADDAVWQAGEWQFPDDERRTLHHLARGVFFTTGTRVEAKKLG